MRNGALPILSGGRYLIVDFACSCCFQQMHDDINGANADLAYLPVLSLLADLLTHHGQAHNGQILCLHLSKLKLQCV